MRSVGTRFALLVDGAFLIKKTERKKGHFPSVDEIKTICSDIGCLSELSDFTLFRTYFYHARPAKGELINPLDKSKLNLGSSLVYREHDKLIKGLEMAPSFAVRLGEIAVRDWKIGARAMKSLVQTPRQIQAHDLVPNIEQKGVDLRIGLDIAKLSLQRLVDAVVIVTGDSDLIPVLKFARREGLQVFLCSLDHMVRRDLKVHADGLLKITI